MHLSFYKKQRNLDLKIIVVVGGKAGISRDPPEAGDLGTENETAAAGAKPCGQPVRNAAISNAALYDPGALESVEIGLGRSRCLVGP